MKGILQTERKQIAQNALIKLQILYAVFKRDCYARGDYDGL
jgi:hypothetical protein